MNDILIQLSTEVLIALGRRMEREGFRGTLAEYAALLLIKKSFLAGVGFVLQRYRIDIKIIINSLMIHSTQISTMPFCLSLAAAASGNDFRIVGG